MAKKKLYRSKDHKIISGVSAGLAEYFDIDTTLVRLIFVVLLFVNGVGALLYLVLLIAMSEKPNDENRHEDTPAENLEKFADDIEESINKATDKLSSNNKDDSRRNLLAMILILIGLLIFVNQIYPGWIRFEFFWPALLIVAGLFLLLKNK